MFLSSKVRYWQTKDGTKVDQKLFIVIYSFIIVSILFHSYKRLFMQRKKRLYDGKYFIGIASESIQLVDRDLFIIRTLFSLFLTPFHSF